MNLKEWLKIANEKLSYQECVYLAKAVLGIQTLEFELKPIALKCLNFALNERVKNIPLAKIIQKKYFMDSAFITTKDTLDPRPETEFLIENISIKPRTILDLGTGTGCLALSILKKFPKSKALAIDISEKALIIAKKNAMRLNLTKRIEFKKNNWAIGIKGKFDLIIANPPYIISNEICENIEFEPKIALFGNIETYKALFASISEISFMEMLIEVPEYLIDEIKKLNIKCEFKQIYNTKIYMMCINSEEGINIPSSFL